LAFAISALSSAAENAIAGKWNCVGTSVTGQKIPVTIIVKEDAGKFSGMLILESGDQLSLVDPKADADHLTFKVMINDSPYSFDLKIDGVKLSGAYDGKDASGSVEGTKAT
jgi:hypothetical protein